MGRDSDCSLVIRDDKHLSGRHFRIDKNDGIWRIEDLQSRNGTFVNGSYLRGVLSLNDSSVIVAGNSVFVFHEDISRKMSPPVDSFGMTGAFYLEEIIESLQDAAVSSRHILLTGPSGSGKELCGRALRDLMFPSRQTTPFMVCNAARFSSAEQAVAALFGVGKNVFSSVASREGLIESADGGVLFLDEAHTMAPPVQRSLLRVIETGECSRLGNESELKHVTTRFILTSNAEAPLYGFVHDLYARLLTVHILPLSKRMGDVPTIFNAILNTALERHRIDESTKVALRSIIDVDHYEMMCIDGFPSDNVRGIIDLCDRIAGRLVMGALPAEAVDDVFSSRFAASPVYLRLSSPEDLARGENFETAATSEPTAEATSYKGKLYRANRALIIELYRKRAKGNISALSRILATEYRLNTTRHSLTIYLQKWGILTGEPTSHRDEA